MDIKNILSLKSDRDNLKDCVSRFENFIIDHQDCDKHGLGFNLDDRFNAARSHSVSFDSWKGYYGNSSCSSYLRDIYNTDKFWKYFDEYLNDHKEEILNYISYKFNDEIIKNVDVIKGEIDDLNNIIKELDN